MTTASEAANSGRTFSVGDREYRFKKVGSLRMNAIFEDELLDDLVKSIKRKALAFDDPADRTGYISAELEKIPAGKALAALNKESPVTLRMIARIVALSTGLDEDEAIDLVSDSTVDEMKAINEYLIGGNSPDRKTAGQSSGHSQKPLTRSRSKK